jgi:hypothetical protein
MGTQPGKAKPSVRAFLSERLAQRAFGGGYWVMPSSFSWYSMIFFSVS